MKDNYNQLSREIAAAGARLVAVSKTHSVEKIMALYEEGHRDFGENRVGELVEKAAQLPDDINWHFIGHLQRNKVRDIVGITSLIHSGDSLRLLRELDKRGGDAGCSVDVLLQYHIAEEESKYGLTPASGRELMEAVRKEPLSNVRIVGVMGMATYSPNEEMVTTEFRKLHEIYADLKEHYFADEPAFQEISTGMSGDYKLALAQGSTLVRIGSLLFGDR